jgi:hypothetical protein
MIKTDTCQDVALDTPIQEQNDTDFGVRSSTLMENTNKPMILEPDEIIPAPFDSMETLGTGIAEFISGLLRGLTVKEAAENAGFSERTGYRLLSRSDVEAELKNAHRRILQSCETRLLVASEEAITTLLNVIRNPKASDATKVRASAVLLDHNLKLSEQSLLTVQSYWLDKMSNMEGY